METIILQNKKCRTRVFENRFGIKTSIGRGNLSFSTINLVRLGIEAKLHGDKNVLDYFYEQLNDKMELVASQLYDRYLFQCKAYKKQFPLLMSGMWNGSENLSQDDKVEEVLKQGTLGIGFIGLAETLVAMFGKHHGESEEMQKLGLEIITFMNKRCKEFAETYNLNYSLLASPAEGLSGRFTKLDKKKYGIIKGVTDREYYTNSSHVPVYYKCSAFHKIKTEAPYHELTRGGHIFYVELDGNAVHNPDAIDKIIQECVNNNIGYLSINHNKTICLDCGFETIAKDVKECSNCGSTNLDILQRITGYLVGSSHKWNSSKLAELHDRITHN